MRHVVLAGVSCLLALGWWTSQINYARAQTPTVPGSAGPAHYPTGDCWIDSATGKRVSTRPYGTGFGPLTDPNHAHNDTTGQNYNQEPNGNWIDSQTGQSVDTRPDTGPQSSPLTDPNRAHNQTTGQNYVRVPCPPPATASNATASPTPAPVPRPPIGEAGLDFAHFSPSAGASGDQFGLSGSALFPTGNLSLLLNGSYHNTTVGGLRTANWTLGVTPFLVNGLRLRLGPSVCYQSNSAGSSSIPTYNYGFYGESYTDKQFTLGAKAGGFSSSSGGSSGWYSGIGTTYYPNPNFGLSAGIDYNRVTTFGGSSETDYSLGLESQLSRKSPASLYLRTTYGAFTGFSVTKVNAGLNFHFNGGGVNTLADSQRTGVPATPQCMTALRFQF